jgi:hypothetical protein
MQQDKTSHTVVCPAPAGSLHPNQPSWSNLACWGAAGCNCTQFLPTICSGQLPPVHWPL